MLFVKLFSPFQKPLANVLGEMSATDTAVPIRSAF